MPTILQEFNKAVSQDNLFLAWEDEFQLRKQLRADPSADEGLRIEDAADFYFLQRALYNSDYKERFWELLYDNRDSLTVLDCLNQAPMILVTEFLAFIHGSILGSKTAGRNLQFLINLYREDLRPDFVALIDAMDADLCAYLVARTSNEALRELLQNRRATLSPRDKIEPYGLTDPGSGDNYPTLFGDKIKLIAAAAKSLQTSRELMATAPLRGETVAALLQGAEILFQAGLMTDCLALTAELIRQPGAEIFDLLLDPSAPYHKAANQLLRKALPLYCLLMGPADPHRYALELHRSLFPGFSPDAASLIYLDINAIVVACRQGRRQYGRFEIAQQAVKLKAYRPDDLLASTLHGALISGPVDLPGLQQIIDQRLTSLPHEAFTIMGVLLLMHQEGRIVLDQAVATRLLQDYLSLFYWIPAAAFMNAELGEQLAPLSDRASRREAERVIKLLQDFHPEGADYAAGSAQSVSWDNHRLYKRLRLSKYMGGV